MIMKFRLFLIACVTAGLMACTPPTEIFEGLVVSNATVKAPMKGRNVTAGYFEITNHSDVDDALIDVSSLEAERVEMHKTEVVDNVSKMRRQVSIDIPAGETVTFQPGGLHLMLFGVDFPEGTQDVTITLKFKHADAMTIVAELGGTENHAHH